MAVVQEYDRKKKLAGDLGNGVVRFNLSPAKVLATCNGTPAIAHRQ